MKMRDEFFNKTVCDRCKGSLVSGRMMSMYNTDCLCLKCIDEERHRDDYNAAREADIAEIKKGNYNFGGIGFQRKKE